MSDDAPSLSDKWVSHPHEWQPLFDSWASRHADLCEMAEAVQLGEHRVLALTIGHNRSRAAQRRLVVAVPHAHEPAGTAACVCVASELLTGTRLDGSPTDLPRDDVLDRLLVTLVPDGNPQGRARSPERVWDGTHDDDYSLKAAFGIAADGQRFGRYPRWRFSEHAPRQVGIEYEQIADDIWCEPNTDVASTHCRLMDRLFARYSYTHYLSLHQHEYREAALLPSGFGKLDAGAQSAVLAWAGALLEAWRAVGADPRPEPEQPTPARSASACSSSSGRGAVRACCGLRRRSRTTGAWTPARGCRRPNKSGARGRPWPQRSAIC